MEAMASITFDAPKCVTLTNSSRGNVASLTNSPKKKKDWEYKAGAAARAYKDRTAREVREVEYYSISTMPVGQHYTADLVLKNPA